MGILRVAHKRQRRSGRRERLALSRIAVWLERVDAEPVTASALAFTVVVSVLAIGGVHPEVMLVLGVSSSVALAGSVVIRATSDRPEVSRPWVVVVLWGLAAWCLVQIVPLPMSLLSAIAPSNADIWTRASLPLGEPPPSFAPLSLDPGATRLEALRWFSYGSAFFAASTLATLRGARWGIGLVFATAIAAAVATVAHGLVGADKVYGLYAPSFRPQPWHVGPLLNPNNLSGLLNLGALAGLGMLLSERSDEAEAVVPRWAIAVGVAVLVGVDVTTASRGGVVMLLLGVLSLGAVLELSRRRHSSAQMLRARLVLASVVALGTVLALLGGTTMIWRELLDENVEKLQLALMVRPAIGDFPIFGMGRGSFESVFPAYQAKQGYSVFTHAENFVAQWVVEWGVPVAAAALIALGYLLGPRRLRVRKNLAAAGAWIGMVVLVLQNLVDLGLEVPGLCFSLAVVAGSLWGDASAGSTKGADAPEATAVVRRGALALAAGLALVTLAFGARHDLTSERLSIKARLRASPPPRQAGQLHTLRTAIRDAMRRHPAEPYFPLIGGMLAWEEKDESPIPWLQRVLERSLANGKAHLLLAQVLQHMGSHKQALLELRLATESDQTLIDAASQLALRFTKDIDELAEAIPKDGSAGTTWDALGSYAKDRKLGRACDARAARADPTRVGPHERLAGDLITAAREGTDCASDADRARCAADIEAHVALMEQHAPELSTAARTRARWLAVVGSADEAEKTLAERCDRARDLVQCLQARADIATKLDAERFAAATRAFRAAACIDQRQCAYANTWIGDAYGSRGEHGNAVVAYERAIRDEETDERLLKLADAAGNANLASKAMRALERLLARRGGKDPALQARIQQQRQHLVESILDR